MALPTDDIDFWGVADAHIETQELWQEIAAQGEQPVGFNQPPLALEDEDKARWWDGYEEPELNTFEWSGPIQPNAPPLPVEDIQALWEADDVAADIDDLRVDSAPVVADVFPLPLEDGWQWENVEDCEPVVIAGGSQNSDSTLATFDEFIQDDGLDDDWLPLDADPVGPDASIPAQPIADAEWEDAAVGDDWETNDSAPVGPDLPASQPPDDPWTFDDDPSGVEIAAGHQSSDPLPLAIEDPQWLDDDGAEDVDSLSAPVGPDVVVSGPPDDSLWLDEDYTEDWQTDSAPVVSDDAVASDEWLQDDAADEWDANDSAPVVPDVQTLQPPEDPWTFDDEIDSAPSQEDSPVADAPIVAGQIFDDPWNFDEEPDLSAVASGHQSSDAALAQLFDEPWIFDEDADAELVQDSAPVADAPVPPSQLFDDPWPFDDEPDSSSSTGGHQTADVAIVPSQPPQGEDWDFAESVEEFHADDFGNEDLDDPPLNDDWNWDEDHEGVIVPGGHQTADAPVPPSQLFDDPWSFDDEPESSVVPGGTHTVDVATVPTQPVQADDWDFAESVEEFHADDFGNEDLDDPAPDDYWPWDEGADEDGTTTGDDGVGPDAIIPPSQLFEDPWPFDDHGEVTAFDGGQQTADAPPVPPSPIAADTHDPGTQVIRESHLKKFLKEKQRKPKKGAIERADLLAERHTVEGKSVTQSAQQVGDDEMALMVYLADESVHLTAIVDTVVKLLGDLDA